MDYEQLIELNAVMGWRKKVIKWIVISVLLVVAFLLFFFTGYDKAKDKSADKMRQLEEEIEMLKKHPSFWDEQPTQEISMDVIQYAIEDIGELATIEYMYTDAGKFEDAKELLGIDMPFTKKYFIARWDGKIKAGVRIDEVRVEVDNASKKIIIFMPNAVILSHEIDSNSIETLDEKDGLFNKVTVADIRNFDKACKDRMTSRAVENGILSKASQNAQEIIAKLVNTEVVQKQGYEIVFESLIQQ